jgi:Tfp pilus assembly protein PilF
LNEAIHLDPTNPGARTNLGLALFALGQYERALAEMNEATRLAPNNSLVFLNRAGTYARLGLLERAIEDYNEALRLDPKAILAHLGLGNAHDSLGRRVQAIHNYDMALQLNPKNARVYTSRGNARRAEGDWKGALEDFSKAIEINPKFAEAYVLRGWSLLCSDRDGAEADARAYLALQERPDSSTLYMSLLGALGARKAGNETEARVFLARALSSGGGNGSAWPGPVLRYMDRSMPAQAMLEAAGDDLQKTEAHVFLALDLLQSGKQNWALEHLRWARDHGVPRSSSADLARVVLLRLESTEFEPVPQLSAEPVNAAGRR